MTTKKPPSRNKEDNYLTCIHEAGHLVVAYLLRNCKHSSVTVKKDGDYDGAVFHFGLPIEDPKALRRFLGSLKKEVSKKDYLRHEAGSRKWSEQIVMSHMAGDAAWCVQQRFSQVRLDIFPVVATVSNVPDWHDLIQSEEILSVYEPAEGRRSEWFKSLWRRTVELVRTWMPAIRRVAKILQKSRTLDRIELEEVYAMLDKMETKRKEKEA